MYNDLKIPDGEDCQTCALTFAYNEIKILYDIAVMLSNNPDVEESIEKGMRLLKRNAYLERSSLFLLSDDNTSVELYSSIEITAQQRKMAVYKLGEGATGLAAQSGEPVVIENIHNNINYLNKMGIVDTKSISYVAVPIIQDENVFGVISANINKNSILSFDDIVRMLTIVGTLFCGTLATQKRFVQEKENLSDLKTYYKEQALSDYKFENIVGNSTKCNTSLVCLRLFLPQMRLSWCVVKQEQERNSSPQQSIISVEEKMVPTSNLTVRLLVRHF